MKFLDDQTKSDIQQLLNVARPNLIESDKNGSSKLFTEISHKFGPLAHRVYLALDKPQRSCEQYHHKETRRVMLDPWTVLNRSKDCGDSTIDDEVFWHHGDMIKTLCDYVDEVIDEEASTSAASGEQTRD